MAARQSTLVRKARRREIDALRHEVTRKKRGRLRIDADPGDVERSLARLVLSLVELLRELMEREAIRRLDGGDLTPDEIEAVGTALMRLEKAVRTLARRFGLKPGDLNLDLGPLGRLR